MKKGFAGMAKEYVLSQASRAMRHFCRSYQIKESRVFAVGEGFASWHAACVLELACGTLSAF